MKKQSQTIKRKSIKVKLLMIPLLCVLVGVLVIVMISTYLTRESLLSEMRETGFSSSQRFVNRIEDNTEAVRAMNEQMESQIRSIGNIVIGNRGVVNDAYLTQLAMQTGIDHIFYITHPEKLSMPPMANISDGKRHRVIQFVILWIVVFQS